MANPQKENGYTAIANEIMEALSKYRIPGEQMQCLLFILRKTYGFNKKKDSISLSQFVKGTKLKKPNIVRSLSALLSKKIIAVIKSDNKPAHVYSFNKNFDSWAQPLKKIALSKVITGVIKSDNKSLSKVIPTKVDSTKATITKGIEYPEWLNISLWEEYKAHRKEIKPKMTPRAEEMAIKKLKDLMDEGNNQDKIIEQSIANGWKGLFPVKNSTNKLKPTTYAQGQDAERREMVQMIKDIEDEEKNAAERANKTAGLLPTTQEIS